MTVELQTEWISLDEVTLADVEFIHSMNSFLEVARYNTMGIPKTVQNTHEMLSSYFEDQELTVRTKYAWVIKSREAAEPVGEIGLSLSAAKYPKGEIFFSLIPEQWGKGYGSAAAKRVIQFCFEDLNFHRLEAGVATQNLRSIALLERVGFIREGQHRLILPTMEGWMDNYSYAMLDIDYYEGGSELKASTR